MASVWYVGGSDRKIISSEDWSSVGQPRETSTWDKFNGFSLPQESFTAAQLTILDSDSSFQLDSPDGPRPGSSVISAPSAPLDRAALAEAIAKVTGSFLTPAQVEPVVAAAIAAAPTVTAAASAAVDAQITSKNLIRGDNPRLPSVGNGASAISAEGLLLIEKDKNNKVSRYVDAQGLTWIRLHPSVKIDGAFSKSVNGVDIVWAIKDPKGRIALGITSSGKIVGNFSGILDDGVGVPAAGFYKSSSSSKQIKIVSGPDVCRLGDSLTAGGNYPDLSSRLGGRKVYNAGVGGETSMGIAARSGAMPYMLLPVGGSIPASGPVTVGIKTASGLDSWPLLQGTGIPGEPMRGKLSGVSGVLTLVKPTVALPSHGADDYYVFTRDAAGDTVAVTRPKPFVTDFSESRRSDIFVIWAGRNNLSQPDRILADVAAMIQHMTALEKRFLVLSTTNGAGEGSGTTAYTNVTYVNSQLSNRYGRRFVDLRRYAIDYGLADLGITPTTQDNADIAADTTPASLRTDSVHFTPGAQSGIINAQIAERIIEMEW